MPYHVIKSRLVYVTAGTLSLTSHRNFLSSLKSLGVPLHSCCNTSACVHDSELPVATLSYAFCPISREHGNICKQKPARPHRATDTFQHGFHNSSGHVSMPICTVQPYSTQSGIMRCFKIMTPDISMPLRSSSQANHTWRTTL